MKKDVCRTDWGTRFVTWISMLCARLVAQVSALCARVGVRILVWMLVLIPMCVYADFTPQSNSIDNVEKTGAWTPTDAGLVVKLNAHDQFRLSTVIGGVEYFVCDYSGHTGGKFKYTTGDYLKLVPRNADGTPPDASLWDVGQPLARANYVLVDGMDGIVYTMWSVVDEGETSKTIVTEGDDYSIKTGKLLASDKGLPNNEGLCDVVFAVPTVRSRINMDPTNTMGRGYPFDGQMGVDAKGEVWREVYWFHKSRKNGPHSYAAFGLTAFNTTTGKAYQINGKTNGQDKLRMLFRLYIVQGNPFETCPNSYFFAHDEQNYRKFLKFTRTPILPSDTTVSRKIYTQDHFHRMTRIGTTKYHQSGPYQIPAVDSTFFYIGKNNEFYSKAKKESLSPPVGTDSSFSAFTNIRQLRIRHLADKATSSGDPFIAPVGAYGRIIVDTTTVGVNNLGATFDPVGYFFRTSSGVNVPMIQQDDSTWITATMWHIEGDFMNLKGIVLLYSDTTFSSTDPGVAIPGWSDSVPAPNIPVFNHPGETASGKSGWARIHTNRPETNGGIEFVLANTTGNRIEYSNNGHFGVELPPLYPMEGSNTVVVQAPQLLQGYEFYGWNTTADTTQGTLISVGTVINFINSLPSGVTLQDNVLKLYAKARYTGSINVAISFVKDDGKRYFMSFPSSGSAYARAQHYKEWTNTWQGMGNGITSDSNYLATFKLIGKETECAECTPGEYVLDPHRHTMYGNEDSLEFYKTNQMGPDSYIGLYYEPDLNIVLYNSSWAGLFQSSRGWPTPAKACVDSTRLFSTHYLSGWPESVRMERAVPEDPDTDDNEYSPLPSTIAYRPATNQFDGVADNDSTVFTLSGVGVVDAHYIILPDTTSEATPWTEAITFGFHKNQQTDKQVYSKLIGKQLLAQMKVGKDTIYFHPNTNKTLSNANALAMSRDYRLTHKFTYIRDARVEALSVVSVDDKTTVTGTDEASFHCTVTSGESSPIGVQTAGGQYIDIVDTLRVWLEPSQSSRIKRYYGRWNAKAEGLHVQPDGSRYRDILVTTKTYHYGDEQKTLRLVPSQESYSFGSLKNASGDVNFTLELITWRELYDVDDNRIRIDTFSITDTTAILDLSTGTPYVLKRDDVFTLDTRSRTGICLKTKDENTTALNRDTLFVTTTVTLDDTPFEVTCKVPLLQVSTIGNELIWSVEYGGKQYFIMGSTYNKSATYKDENNLRIQDFTITSSARLQRNTRELFLGSKEVDGKEDRQHIRPWRWYDVDVRNNQLTLKTEYGIEKYFHINGTKPEAASYPDSTILTFEIVTTYTNSNGNYEEIVYLKYGSDYWLGFKGDSLVLVGDTTGTGYSYKFSWAYMRPEYNLLNNGTYPSKAQEEFGYNTIRTGEIQTRYQAYLDYSMLLNNQLVHVCKTEEKDIAKLINPDQKWKTQFTDSIIRDSRMATPSGLSISRIDTATLTTYIAQSGTSPLDVKDKLGQNANIVDTLDFRITLRPSAPEYRFAGNWSGFRSVENAHLKIPLIRRTYHEELYDSITCAVDKDEYNYSFPAVLRAGVRADSVHTFILSTYRNTGTKVYDVSERLIATIKSPTEDLTDYMDLGNISRAEVRLRDNYGNKPSWCEIIAKEDNIITVRCKTNGIRTPRMAYIDIVYVVMVDETMRFVNYHLTVSQASYFQYDNNQTLYHTVGASGDPLVDGKQQTHENKRILYYYNPEPYNVPDQDVELPLRERGFYGWWRWYRDGKDQNGAVVSDTDIPDSVWITPPRNLGGTGNSYNFPYRIIGDSVDAGGGKKKLVTMGRYTVFHYPSSGYTSKWDPAAKTPRVKPPFNKDTVTYVVDISNYYDNLPLSTKSGQKNQIDTAKLDTAHIIYEPTLSLREVYELHPWTEMAARLDDFKSTRMDKDSGYELASERYLEDHVVMAPIGTHLLLQTEQRYVYDNLAVQKFKDERIKREGHSESLLGYYMRDDNWDNEGWDAARKDTMIWCGGWDADCKWYTYDPKYKKYASCAHSITVDDDFLDVPAKGGIPGGHNFDTVYYCLRARSWKSTFSGTPETVTTDSGDFMFNICRYMVIYHRPDMYGPLEENARGKALITNAEIEQDYEILEQLNFDYNKPGSDYQVYPHPLPWNDCSYGYTYPLSSSALPNRYHKQKDFPGPGEYALINKIPTVEHWSGQNMGNETYWRAIEQHGGAADGYMIYCDGMSSSGQVAALSLQTRLCHGQKMYFSGYVGNVSNQIGKSNPNFTISVQGSANGIDWYDITSYMTGDIAPSDKWYQIFFPINLDDDQVKYTYFRVRIYNMASSFDGNDFVIDDMCIFATKPPLIAYQAKSTCTEDIINDSLTHVVLRVDYQGFVDPENYNNTNVYYTIDQETENGDLIQFIEPLDHYLHESTIPYSGSAGSDPSDPDGFELGPDVGQAPIPEPIIDTIFGYIHMPAQDYVTADPDSIFSNLNSLIEKFDNTYRDNPANVFRQGYIYEDIDGTIRPVMYIVHLAKLAPNNIYKVRMAYQNPSALLSSICAMTSDLRVSNRMVLEINGEEQPTREVVGMCSNNTYDISLRVKGSLILDSVAPIDLNGACKCDWLLYGDTAEASSLARYGYRYSDIKKVITQILRYETMEGKANANQFASNFRAINRRELTRIQNISRPSLSGDVNAYNLIKTLVDNGFLTLYQSNIQATVTSGDSIQYVIMPIVGTGSDVLHNANVEVCPVPILIKLKPDDSVNPAPLILGGLHRDSTQAKLPPVVLLNEEAANEEIAIHIDSIAQVLDSVYLISTNDPNYLEGIHQLQLVPDREWNFSAGSTNEAYYHKGDTIRLHPLASTYHMRAGYTYTFVVTMQDSLGRKTVGAAGCRVGMVPFTVSVVPDYLRWNPQSEDAAQWNDPDNWVGIDEQNRVIHSGAHFAPLASTKVIIPAMTDDMPYPVIPSLSSLTKADSVQQVGFVYNTCDAIRFLPGAAMGQQQHLIYNDVVVDMSIPNQKWSLRATPVTGLISGDIFMANADLLSESTPWEVGSFDANGRNYTTGNASFWLSLYSRETERVGGDAEIRSAEAAWSKVTNGMNLDLSPAQGWAVYTHTRSETTANIRLPKNDDIYYYFEKNGKVISYLYEDNLRAMRDEKAGGSGQAGKLAFQPDGESKVYNLTNEEASTSFVFGNPTMGYIDIWGFIADNSLTEEFSYLDAAGHYTTVTAETTGKNTINNPARYLPPMHAMVINVASKTKAKEVTLNKNRIVTDTIQVVRPSSAPSRTPKRSTNAKAQGIMTITAINPVSDRCVSRLLLGQGYHDAILSGEDAILTTLNIDRFSMTSTPTTPFNLYAVEGEYGMNIDLRDSIVYVPLSFYNSNLPYDSVTYLWFTGVNAIEGPLVLYDALLGTERQIIDGICLDIETPEMSHQMRYYIRRPGYVPQSQNDNPIATGFETETANNDAPRAQKIYYQGHVYILRDGHVYTIFGQQIR